MLENSLRGINPLQKRWLYRCCALPIALYGFQLWYYNKTLLNYSLNILRKMQQRAALWISGVFCTLSTAGIEAISSLIPIYLHLKKLYSRFLLRGLLLPSNHIIKSILSSDGLTGHTSHSLSLDNLQLKQRLCLNSSLINIDNNYCHKLHSACISTTSGLIFTNQVMLESPKWGSSAHIQDVQNQQQMTEISGYQ